MPNIDISWEDKKYYNNTSSTSYGNPVTALVSYGPDGRPRKDCLTKAGIEYFYGKEEAAPAPARKPESKSSNKSSNKSSSDSSKSNASSAHSQAPEPRQPRPLSESELYWINLDPVEYETPETNIYVSNLFRHYFNVQNISPEFEHEGKMRAKKLFELATTITLLRVPEKPEEFFLTLMNLERLYNKFHSRCSETMFSEASLYGRMREIGYKKTDKQNNPLYAQEVLDMVWDIEYAEFNNNMSDAMYDEVEKQNEIVTDWRQTDVYHKVAKASCETMCEKADLASFEKMLDLFKKEKIYTENYLKEFPIPNHSKEEFLAAVGLITNFDRKAISILSRGTIRKKEKDIRNIILAQYSDDSKLMDFVNDLGERETKEAARNYKITKWGSLAVCAVASPFTFVIPLVVWYIVFCRKNIHDKIPFLKKGAEAVNATEATNGVGVVNATEATNGAGVVNATEATNGAGVENATKEKECSGSAERELRNVAKKYNNVKWVSFAVCLVFGSFTMFISLIAWVVVYFTGVHDKFDSLKKGKEAIKKLEELQNNK